MREDTALRPQDSEGAGSVTRRGGRSPLRAVLFDLGDTLMRIEPSVPELYRRSLAELGVEVGEDAVADALRSGEEVYREALRRGRPFESSIAEARSFWEEYNAHLVGALGLGRDGEARRLARALSDRFWSAASWRPFPETTTVLRELRRRDLRIGIVSNFAETLVAVCAEHGLLAFVECAVASTVVGTQKPDPAIFVEALRRLEVAPAEALHVGDNYVNDVLGARAAGIVGVLVDRSRRGVPGMFDFALRDGIGSTRAVPLDCPVIGSLDELFAVLS